MEELLRNIPSVNEILERGKVKDLAKIYPRWLVVLKAREVVEEYRSQVKRSKIKKKSFSKTVFEKNLIKRIESLSSKSLKKVVNCTGIVIHTNLARAPISDSSADSVKYLSSSYSNIEYDIEKGTRGTRTYHCVKHLRTLTGAEDALVVNNTAGALLLILSALSKGKNVLISRGEIVEIGGGFRVNEILKASGAKLFEVGTTNKTRFMDYEIEASEKTGAILKVHTSNFEVVGFSQSTELKELVRLGRTKNIPVIFDAGSGLLEDLSEYGLEAEPLISDAVRQGADLVTFSGDKLLGGPQAGIIVGRKDLLKKIKKHPLYRALRVCKMTISALESTLIHYVKGEHKEKVPVLKMITTPLNELKKRAKKLSLSLIDLDKDASFKIGCKKGRTYIGGGSYPAQSLNTWLVSMKGKESTSKLSKHFRENEPSIVTRISDDELLFDLRTVFEQDFKVIEESFKSLMRKLKENI